MSIESNKAEKSIAVNARLTHESLSPKTPQFIDFRRHVNQLIRDGSIDDDLDPVIYSIKERQIREYIFRTSGEGKMSRAILEDSELTEDDYLFLIKSIDSEDSYRALHLITLHAKGISNRASPLAKVYIRKIIESLPESEDMSSFYMFSNPIKNKNIEGLLSFIGSLYEDESQMIKAVEKTLEASKKDPLNISISAYKSLFSNLSDYPLAGTDSPARNWPQKERILRQLEPTSKIGSLKSIDRSEQIQIINSMMGADYKLNAEISSRNASEPTDEFDELIEVASIVKNRAEDHLEIFFERLKSSPVTGLDGFGKGKTKEHLRSNHAKILEFTTLLSESSVNDSLKEKLMTHIIIRLCSGNTRMYDKNLSENIMSKAKDMVDWNAVFDGIEDSPRKFVLSSMKDRRYYIDHIKKGELGDYVRDDMGL